MLTIINTMILMIHKITHYHYDDNINYDLSFTSTPISNDHHQKTMIQSQ